jgi:hypothetical protein
MHGSRVFRSPEAGNVAMKAVAGALCKMARATATPLDPFDNLESRTVLCFEKGAQGRVYWSDLKHLKKGRWEKFANPGKCLFKEKVVFEVVWRKRVADAALCGGESGRTKECARVGRSDAESRF